MADLNDDIEKYLKGELSPADRHRLERMALDDPFLAEALEGAEEVKSEDYQEGLQQIHAAIDKRIAKKGGSGLYWPMRIAAGLLLLVCSSYLIWIFIENQNTANDLALNTSPESVTAEEVPSMKADSIIESVPEEKIQEEETAEEKPSVVKTQPAQKDAAQPLALKKQEEEKLIIAEQTKPAAIAKTETKTEADSGIKIADNNQGFFSKTVEEKEESKKAALPALPESISRSKTAAPAAAEPSASGVAADKYSGHRIITGKVTDLEDGAPLPGVNVIVKGTTVGVMTDLEGNYKIQVEDNDFALVFSFIGLETREELIEGQSQLNVEMDQDVSQLSEVVVTAYGYSDNDIFTNTLPDYVAAEPEGGFKAYKIYLDDNLHYPIQAIENKVQGKVTVRFDISPAGVISDFQITKGIGFGCDEEAIRLIRQGPKWTSPKRGDTPVKGRVKVRVRFSLPK